MSIDFTPSGDLERIQHADEEIAEILEKYKVEWRSDYDCEMWLEPIEQEPPKLKVV